MTSRPITVSDLMLRARETADMQRSNFVSDEELVRMISSEYTELYDILTTTYEHYYARPVPFIIQQVTGVDTYDLPKDFYKMAGVERIDGDSEASGPFTTMYPFPWQERNIVGAFNLFTQRYCILGDKVVFKGGSLNTKVRVFYIPSPPELTTIYKVDSVDVPTSTFTLADHGFVDGDFVHFKGVSLPGGVSPSDRVKSFIVNSTPNTFQVSLIEDDAPVTLTSAGAGSIKVAWYGAGQVIDGVAGWDEIIVVSTAIRMLNKEETDTSALAKRKVELKDRITAAAHDRDAGNAPTVTDVRSMVDLFDIPYLFRG